MAGAVRAIGRRIPRVEDPRLLSGGGRYVADIRLPGMLHAAFVRSPVPHGILRSIDSTQAARDERVRAIATHEQLVRLGVREIPVGAVLPGQRCRTYPALASDRVYYVGQPVAIVVATDPYAAEDAAERVELEIDGLPAVVDPLAALESDAPSIYEGWGTNVAVELKVEGGDVDAAFEAADVVVSERFAIHRHAGCPIETRGIVATHEPGSGNTTAWVSTQAPHHMATLICETCGWPEHTLRVIAPDVGGAFGTKEPLQGEELAVCVMARRLAAPVRWIEDRREHLLSTVHAREQVWDVELAADKDGGMLGIRGRVLANVGGHLSNVGVGPAQQAAGMFPGPYRLENLSLVVQGVITNKVPSGAYRGFGMPQAAFVMERLVDELARATGIDRVTVRRRNLIPHDALPYTSVTGYRYDSGDYEGALDALLAAVGHEGLADERERARGRGRLLGLGIGTFVMVSGLAPSRILGAGGAAIGGYESAVVRMNPSGTVTVLSGTPSQGQGHATTLAQACADVLGVDPEQGVAVVAGDSALTPYDPAGAVGSRVGSVAGGAVILASGLLRDKLARIAAHLLEANESDIELADGKAFVRGSADRGIELSELAHAAHLGHDLPADVLPALEERATHEPADSSFPYSAHAAIVELDPRTGRLEILRYVVVNDCGVVLNPTVVEGQIRGGVVQEIGGATLERLAYDEAGQPLSTSFMDYLLPTASDVPDIEIIHRETPCPHIPGGMKGVGEAGAIAPLAVIANAVADALEGTGAAVRELPLDLEAVWRLAGGAGEGAGG